MENIRLNVYIFGLAASISHIIVDAVILELVVPIIWRLRISSQSKLTILVALGSGLLYVQDEFGPLTHTDRSTVQLLAL